MSYKSIFDRLTTCITLTLISCLFVSGCSGASEKEAVDELRELGALVVLDVYKKASSLVLPNDGEKIQQAIPLLPKLKKLTSLSAINTPVTDEAMVRVGNLKRLTNLDLSGTGITDAGVAHLVSLSNLSSLNLASTKVTSECLADVGQLSSIDILNLANNSLSGGFENLAGCENLSWLVLSHLKVSVADAEALAKLPKLEHLSATDHVEISAEAKSVLVSNGVQVDAAVAE
jgi:hypothetical protein